MNTRILVHHVQYIKLGSQICQRASLHNAHCLICSQCKGPQLNKYRKYVQSFKEYTRISRQLVILVGISSLIVRSSTPQWEGRWGSRAARCRRSAAWRACRWRRRACWGSCRQSRWSGRRSYPAARALRRSPPGRRLRAARRWIRTGCSCGSAADEEDLQVSNKWDFASGN